MAEPITDIFALFGPIPPHSAEPGTEALKAAHERQGVVGAAVLSTRGIYHSAAAGNRETLAKCAESGGRFLPLGVLDPRVPAAHTLLNGARGVALFPATQNWPVAYAPLEESLQQLKDSRIPLFFEATRPGDATALRALLRATGFGAPVVLFGVPAAGLAEAFALASGDARYLLCTDRLRGVGELALAVENLGPDRVLFGSGAIARGSLGAAIATARAAGLDPAHLTQVFSGNARKLLAAGGIA